MSAVPVYSSVIPLSSSNVLNSLMSRDASGNSAANQLTINKLVSTILNSPSVTKTTSFSIVGTEGSLWLFDATSGALTPTLPAASGVSGLVLLIVKKDSSANHVTLGTVGENIVVTGSATTTFALSAQGNGVLLFSDGTNWYGLKS